MNEVDYAANSEFLYYKLNIFSDPPKSSKNVGSVKVNPILLNGRFLKPGLCENVCNYFIFLDNILEFFDFS